MNLPSYRIAVSLGKAALKTHALQTLRDCRAFANRAKRLECVRFIGAFRPACDGPQFMVPMHSKKRKGALHEPQSELHQKQSAFSRRRLLCQECAQYFGAAWHR